MNKIKFIAIILLLSLITTGCWDLVDISNRAFVNSVAVDTAEQGSEKKYKITLEIVRPVAWLERNLGEEPSIIHSVDAESISDAVEQIQAKISRPISFGHVRLLLMGEEVARRENVRNTFDFFSKNPDIAKRIRVMFVEGSEAGTAFYAKPEFDKFMTTELVSMTNLDHQLSTVIKNEFEQLMADLFQSKGNGLGTRLVVPGENTPVIRNGGAVFKDWRLIGWLTAEEAQAVNWLVGDANSIVVAKTENKSYTYRVDKQSAKITPYTKEGRLAFKVNLKTDGILRQEINSGKDVSEPENIDKIEELFARTITGQIRNAIDIAQIKYRVDILGFGQALRRKDPQFYRTLNWEEVFPNVPVDVEVNAHVTRFGLSN